MIPEIRLANIIPGVTAPGAEDKGINETFVGLIQTTTEQHRAYIKVLSSRQLVNELVCSTLGRAVGLPIPEGFIVQATAADLPESGMLAKHDGGALIFACADVGRPSLKRRLTEMGSEFLNQLFASWKHWEEAAIFDEWIANPDRHAGNLLIEGPDKVWLIDHGHALTGPDWAAVDLAPDRVVRNQIAEQRFPGLTLPERMATRSKAGELSKLFGHIDVDAAISASHADKLLTPQYLAAVNGFIGERVEKLFDLVSSRLNIPNLGV